MKPWLPESMQQVHDTDIDVARAEQQARLLAHYWDELRSIESLECDIGYWLANASEKGSHC